MTPVMVGKYDIQHLQWNGEKYDFIGDIHGCYRTMNALFSKMGYVYRGKMWVHPQGRLPVFLGDIIDKGPNSYSVLKMVMRMMAKKRALYVPGNHCDKLYRYLKGTNRNLPVPLQKTIAQIKGAADGKSLLREFEHYMSKAKSHLILDGGNIVAVHAAVTEESIGVYDKESYKLNLFGMNGGIMTMDVYRGEPLVVHGHIKQREPKFKNHVLNIDTCCGKTGGKLTAYRYPEGNFVAQEVLDIIIEGIKDEQKVQVG